MNARLLAADRLSDAQPLAEAPRFPLSDFAQEEPTFATSAKAAAKTAAMRAAGWAAIGLRGLFGSRSHGRMGILTYHRVSPVIPGLPPPTHNVTPDRLRAHVAGLLDRGFTIWPLREMLRYHAMGRTPPLRTIALTFDDGFESVYTNAFPVLREFHVPATVFLSTAYLDSTAPFPFDTWGLDHRDSLPPASYRPLTVEQCREMAGLIEFGAHSHTHRDLRASPEDFRDDVQTSVDFVRAKFGLGECMFAFPFGSKQAGFAGPELVSAAKQTGVTCGLTTDCALIDRGSDPFEWGRFNVFSWDTAATLHGKLDGWYTWAAQLKRSSFVALPILGGNQTARALVVPTLEPKTGGAHFEEFAPLGKTRVKEIPPSAAAAVARANIVCLTNILAPYSQPVYQELARRAGKMTLLLSSPVGLHGIEKPEWDSLDVRVQRTWTIRRPQRHPMQFDERIDVHVPWRTMRDLAELKPDVIISHETGIRTLLSACYARWKRVPLIVTICMSEHTEKGRGWARCLLRRWIFRQADAVGVNGPSAARYALRLGAKAEQLAHVPYVALEEAKAEVPATRDAESAHRLLYVGQLVERKGLLPFLRVLARWAAANPARHVEFAVVGSGPLEAAIREFSLPSNVTLQLLGRQKPAEMAAFYAAAGIFVLPTLADEWAPVVNEAMASGLPVLGSLYSQAVEVLCADGQQGWTFRPDREEEMLAALEAALNTPPERLDAMREAARRRVAHLTPAYVADQLVEAITRLLPPKEEEKARGGPV